MNGSGIVIRRSLFFGGMSTDYSEFHSEGCPGYGKRQPTFLDSVAFQK